MQLHAAVKEANIIPNRIRPSKSYCSVFLHLFREKQKSYKKAP